METKTKELEQLEADLRRIIEAKDSFVERSRQEAIEVTKKIEAIKAEVEVERMVSEMGPSEKEALRKALGDN